jgi:amidase
VFGDALGIFGPFNCYGPLARTVADLYLALSIMNGPDLRDPYAVPAPLGNPDDVDVASLRVATYLDDGISPPNEDVAAVVSDTVQALKGMVGLVEHNSPPCLERTMTLLWESVFLGGDRGHGFEADLAAIGATDPSEELAEFLKQARLVDFSLSEARSRLTDIDTYRIEMLEFMADYDVIVGPVMPTAAKPHHHGLVEISDFSHLMAHNLTGWPSAVIRCGTSTDGLPIGVQIVAKPWQDATALAVAGRLEAVFGGWRPPPLFA